MGIFFSPPPQAAPPQVAPLQAALLFQELKNKSQEYKNNYIFETFMDAIGSDEHNIGDRTITEQDILAWFINIKGEQFTDIPRAARTSYVGEETPFIWVQISLLVVLYNKMNGYDIKYGMGRAGRLLDYWHYCPKITSINDLIKFRKEWDELTTGNAYIEDYLMLLDNWADSMAKPTAKPALFRMWSNGE